MLASVRCRPPSEVPVPATESPVSALQTMIHFKEKKEFDDAFRKAQKPWAKLLVKVSREMNGKTLQALCTFDGATKHGACFGMSTKPP